MTGKKNVRLLISGLLEKFVLNQRRWTFAEARTSEASGSKLSQEAGDFVGSAPRDAAERMP
ncbi:MAG: hypothetical protein KGM49_01575 [Sphingomonadales bacterium]|nr:hypothetical protein [Sphingomonadales bacterium]